MAKRMMRQSFAIPDGHPDGRAGPHSRLPSGWRINSPVIRMAIRMANWMADAIRMANWMANYIPPSTDGDLHRPP